MVDPFVERLCGIIPPVTTPLTEEGAFDRDSAITLYRRMLDAGVHGLFLFGSSGEGPLLSEADRRAVLETAVETVGSRLPLLAGVLAPGTAQVIAQAKTAREFGVDALVVCPPFYFASEQAELLEHYRAVRHEVDLPIIAYDIPQTAKTKIAPETMLSLAQDGTVVGVKDSSGDLTSFRRLMSERPPHFKLLTGSDLLVDTVLMMGADGSVPGLANVAPERFVQLYSYWRAGEFAQATAVQDRLVRLFDLFTAPDGSIRSGYALSMMKAAQKLRGMIQSDRLQQPFTQVTPAQVERASEILAAAGLL
jgi:4-hydroxy-tetrahydrodipicolinate synthase